MNKMTCVLSVLALAVAPGLALAGAGGTDCASAQVLQSGQNYTGDTSGAGYGNPIGGMGPLPSPGNDAIYTFTAGAGYGGDFTVTAAGFNFGIFLTSNCAGTTAAPIQAATGPTAPASFNIDGQLTVGTQYWVIVSANPADASAPAGTYTFSTPTLPVELQNFSID